MEQTDYDSIADIYDLYVTANYDVSFYLSEVRKVQGPILELMAGTGRLSLPLVEAGAELTCVDGSTGMLGVLSRKLAAGGLRAETICRDVRWLGLAPRFRLAILPFQAFMEIVGEENQRAALASVFASLAPGGHFLCTLHNPAFRRASVDGTLRLSGTFQTGAGTLVVSGFEQGGDPVVRRLQFLELFGADGGSLWKRVLPMEFALVEKEDFEGLACGAGFRVAQLYGSYDRAPFDPAQSAVMIWDLEKPGV